MKLQILHDIDDDGNEIVNVPLSKSTSFATLYLEDYNELMALGVSSRWTLNQGIVSICVPKRSCLSVARIITDAAGERVAYANGDKTDLRRSNLVFAGKGNSKIRARDFVVPTPRLYSKIEIQHVYKDKHGQTGTIAGSVMT
ncbi:hypothetical protein CK489_02170 [Bradyrhizobium sp. UFLA03-84]|uniref:hypothetical protein n=1 Tax=Bradyrhizobium sp. UFLA03-84 TaxID=418599 RepID=UPI000BADEF8C|nr:hypothetical protein [Bradyrhizobium sp. UFLA03-84]PAY10973.1 hypothetical protein CK489_02170 [Bradyrhizobium sp. UFLA03-84]